MTKLIIALVVISLLGVAIPKIYYENTKIPVNEFVKVIVEPKVETTKKISTRNKLVIPVVTPEVEQYISNIFGEDAKIATAVLMHESGLNLNAKGWNCYYYNSEGKRYSTSCKTVTDRENAWSVDCGIAQVNTKGKSCPSDLLTLDGNMEAVERIYKTQGLNAWVSYSTGRYKKFLE